MLSLNSEKYITTTSYFKNSTINKTQYYHLHLHVIIHLAPQHAYHPLRGHIGGISKPC